MTYEQELYDDLVLANEQGLPKYLNKATREELVRRATAKNIPLTKVPSREGWLGKSKGLLQVPWERGWIDDTRLDEYKMGSNLVDSKIDERSMCLVTLLSSTLDFATEITQLQAVAELYGASVSITPKYHCEIAGAGIEHAWGVAKSHYRRILMQERKNQGYLQESCVEES
jgi:hypothetical protein